MPYASYTENITERYLENIRDSQRELEELRKQLRTSSEVESRKRLASIEVTCERLEKQLLHLAEIATHPWISIAHRYLEDHDRLNKLESDARQVLEARRREREALELAIASKNDTEIELRTRVILLEDENKKLKKQLKVIKEDVLYRKNPENLFGPGVKPLKKK